MPESGTPRRIVIVGASLAGASAAVAIAEAGFDGETILLGDELHRPYERPPLSKAILLGEADEPDWVADEDFYAAHGIDLRLGVRVTAIDAASSTVTVDGEGVGYDRLLLATGAEPRRLGLPGADAAGIHVLRTLDQSLALRATFTAGTRVVVVGAGWIGCEVAAAARHHGAHVTVVEPLAQPLIRVLGEQIGTVFADLHRAHDVDLRLGVGVTGFEVTDGRVSGVTLADGSRVPADVVVVGVGVIPRDELAAAAGLDLAAGGVAVDSTLESSAQGIFAAGDLAAHDHPRFGRLRVEHWDTAKEQGTHVAQNLLGASVPYTKSPFFFSDQYDLGCEYRGNADPASDDLVVRGDLGAREFTAFWLRDGAVRAAMNVNMWDDGDALQALVDAGAAVSAEQLRDGDLAALAADAGASSG